ncbi:MAG: AMP-binding protein [Nitrospirota bacterium]
MSEPVNIPQAFEDASKKNPAKTALEMEGKGYTYTEILSSAKSITSFFHANGITQGDRVAIFSEGRPEWVMAYLGISFTGAVAVPIDIQLSENEVRNLIQDSESKAIFVSEKGLKTLKAETGDKRQETSVNNSSLVTRHLKTINLDSEEFSKIIRHPHLASFPSISPDDMASLIYTSGTTGRPKGVMLTHRNFLSNVRSIKEAKLINENDCLLSILPLHHSYPFMVNFLVSLLTGARVVYQQSLKGPDILKTMVERGVTVFTGVPQLFAMLRRGMIDKIEGLQFPINRIIRILLRLSGFLRERLRINTGRIFFSSVHKRFGDRFRFFVSGGAKLDPEVSQDLEALGFTIVEGYGLTETSPVISFNPLNRTKRGSVGLPLPEIEVKIVNPDNDNVGEIAVRGSNVMKGYYRNPEETEKVIKDGWFYTGDLGYIDKDGYLYITGRSKEVIVLSSGKNIYPDEVERHYLESPLIKEICVLGVEKKPGIAPMGRVFDESLQAVVVPDMDYMRENKIANFKEAIGWEIKTLSLKLPPYKRIKGYEVRQSPLPRTPLGKLKRFVVKDLLSGKADEEMVKEERAEEIRGETGKIVIEILERIIEKRPVRLSHNLELDLGIDSLTRVELIVSLGQAFSIELPDTFGSEVYTVLDLIEKIEEFRKGAGGVEAREDSKELALSGAKGWEEILKTEPSLEDQRAVGLVQGGLTKFLITIMINLLRVAGKIFFRLEVRGIENIPDPPYIITPNHASNIDGFVVGISVPIKSFMGLYSLGFQKYFRNWFTSRFARFAHVIPVDPETYLKKALQISGYVLRKGKALCLFPEGGRTFDGTLMPFKKGVGILSKELRVPLVPVLIEGTYEVIPRGSSWPKFGKISVTFGRPVSLEEIDFSLRPENMDDYEWIVLKLRESIVGMKGGNPPSPPSPPRGED